MNKPEKISKKIKDTVIETVLSSTSHGIPNVARSSKTSIKILWSICTIISAGLCCYLIIQNLIDYLNYGVTTTIRYKNELSSLFPTITICNLNFFTTEYTVNTLSDSFFQEQNSKFNYSFFNYYLSTIVYSDENLQLNMSNYGDTKEKLILNPRFELIGQNIREFSYYFHPTYGNCYQFNSGKDEKGNSIPLKFTSQIDRITSFSTILNVSVNEKLKKYNVDFGAIVFIHNHTISPFQINGITLGAQTITNIEVSRHFSKQQPKPFSNCDGNTDKPENYDFELYKFIFAKRGYYTQKECIYQCYQKELINKCNCSDSGFESSFDKKACEFNNTCMMQFYENFFKPKSLNELCMPVCPLECEQMNFKKTVSIQTVESKDENFKDLTALNIYYESIGYNEIEEVQTMTIVSLISNIGGIAGLFLGVSFLSFVEIIEVLIQIIFIFFERSKISIVKKKIDPIL